MDKARSRSARSSSARSRRSSRCGRGRRAPDGDADLTDEDRPHRPPRRPARRRRRARRARAGDRQAARRVAGRPLGPGPLQGRVPREGAPARREQGGRQGGRGAARRARAAPVPDLMSALKASLEAVQSQPANRSARAQAPTTTTKRKAAGEEPGRSPACRPPYAFAEPTPAGPGILRRRRGKGFQYVDAAGTRSTTPSCSSRIGELVIHAAWQEVWICPYPGGHIQATGLDARGRKYLYHQKWRQRRPGRSSTTWSASRARCPRCARPSSATSPPTRCPRAEPRVRRPAARQGFLHRLGGLRGHPGETCRHDAQGHVRLDGDLLLFDLPGQARQAPGAVRDRPRRRRGRRARQAASAAAGKELLAAAGRGSTSSRSTSTTTSRAVTGLSMSARTSARGTPPCSRRVALAVGKPGPWLEDGARRDHRAIKEVAYYHRRRPPVARASYIDPRVFDQFVDGVVIDSTIAVTEADEPRSRAVEHAVLRPHRRQRPGGRRRRDRGPGGAAAEPQQAASSSASTAASRDSRMVKI